MPIMLLSVQVPGQTFSFCKGHEENRAFYWNPCIHERANAEMQVMAFNKCLPYELEPDIKEQVHSCDIYMVRFSCM